MAVIFACMEGRGEAVREGKSRVISGAIGTRTIGEAV
jgi:hypothetical protein